jgi:hypothetical protein
MICHPLGGVRVFYSPFRQMTPLREAADDGSTRFKADGELIQHRINPTCVPIEKKESIRWLENLRQSTELLNDPGRCVHIGDRESDFL